MNREQDLTLFPHLTNNENQWSCVMLWSIKAESRVAGVNCIHFSRVFSSFQRRRNEEYIKQEDLDLKEGRGKGGIKNKVYNKNTWESEGEKKIKSKRNNVNKNELLYARWKCSQFSNKKGRRRKFWFNVLHVFLNFSLSTEVKEIFSHCLEKAVESTA